MTEENENLAKLKEAYRLWHETKAGSAEHWLELLADNVHFRSLAQGQTGMEFTKDRNSKEEVAGYLQALAEQWTMVHYTVHKYIAEGDWIAALGSCGWTHKKTGRTVETPKADFWHFKDGKAVAFYEFYNTARVQDATEEE